MRKSNIRNHVKNYFTFSKSERNGIIILFVLLLIIIVGTIWIPEMQPEDKPVDFSEVQKEVDSYFNSTDSMKIKKVETNFVDDKKNGSEQRQKAQEYVNINTCDSADLTILPGIGPVFASRIIKYRKILGGFHDKKQLLEVYGFKEENFKKASSQLLVNPSEVRLISVDTAGFKTLIRHPYIGKELAWKIINFRKKYNGNGIGAEEFENAQIFDSAQWHKVRPYLIFTKK